MLWAEQSCGVIKEADGPFSTCIERLEDGLVDMYFDNCVKDSCAYVF